MSFSRLFLKASSFICPHNSPFSLARILLAIFFISSFSSSSSSFVPLKNTFFELLMIGNSKSARVYKLTSQSQNFIQYNYAELKFILLLSTLNIIFITTIRFLLLMTGFHLGNVIITKSSTKPGDKQIFFFNTFRVMLIC